MLFQNLIVLQMEGVLSSLRVVDQSLLGECTAGC